MPDYVAEKEDNILVHADELCKSCKYKDKCEFIHILVEYGIATSDSIHVLSCKCYDPDTESKYYVDTSELDALLSDIDEMQKEFIGLMHDLDEVIGGKHESS